ncbi:acetoacetate metabolism transcriptional regulator AtoC [Spirochaetota bacterium]
MKKRILVCDDEAYVRVFLKDLLELEGYTVFEAENGEQAEAIISKGKIDLCVLDLMLTDCSGIDLIPRLKSKNSQLAIVVITAIGTINNAVASMKAGAYDFITKPFDVDTILISVKRALDYVTVSMENKALWNLHKNRVYYEDFIGESPAIQNIKALIPKLANADVPILISGETGTGKNVLAKEIHFTIEGAQAPLIYTNCSSIPSSLFESELFGHEKGSFTGAIAQKKGRIELANGGTLLLDEITEIPYETQAKLLDLLQERSFYRVGGVSPISVNTRIIALTNRDLQEEIKAGRFRKDLFYRLNVIHFLIPPLRDRGDDIILVCELLLEHFRKKYNKPLLSISKEALALLKNWSWPGNIRELKNSLERAFIYAEDNLIVPENLMFEGHEAKCPDRSFKELVEEFERDIILKRLSQCEGSRRETAKCLGMSLRNLQYKLEKFGIA